MSHILQFKVTLRGSKPPIWRRFLISDDYTLSQLHEVLQIVMGWYNIHLHLFEIHGGQYSANKNFEDVLPADMALGAFFLREKEKFEYVYDMGDSWEHILLVEKILPPDPATQHPVCLTGKLNCPLEDVGSIYGYYNVLEIIQNPTHPEYKHWKSWVPKNFDPEYFDLNSINLRLTKKFKPSKKQPKG